MQLWCRLFFFIGITASIVPLDQYVCMVVLSKPKKRVFSNSSRIPSPNLFSRGFLGSSKALGSFHIFGGGAPLRECDAQLHWQSFDPQTDMAGIWIS